MNLSTLLEYTNTLLRIDEIKDYCPNGLQVAVKPEISTIVTGVTASLALIEAAAAKQADLLLVHHGYFWQGEASPLVGMKGKRVQQLYAYGMNMAGYHLPLDVHPTLGNNIALATLLGLENSTTPETGQSLPLILVGELLQPVSAASFAQTISAKLGRDPLLIEGGQQQISRVAVCTGGAQNMIESVIELGVDAYISGEISERTTHVAREAELHYFACGHHATERYGIQRLGEHLAKEYGLTHHFIDIDNPA